MFSIIRKDIEPHLQQKFIEEEVYRVGRELFELLGYWLDKQWVMDLLFDWSNYVELYQNPATQEKHELAKQEFQRIETILSGIEKNRNSIEKARYINLDCTDRFQHETDSIGVDEVISYFKSLSRKLRIKLALLKTLEINKMNKKDILFHGMIRVFSAADSLGLENDGVQHAGRKNKNKFYAFIEIITGIYDREKVARYHKKLIHALSETES